MMSRIVPAASGYAMYFPLARLKAGGNVRRVRLSHMKEERDGIVCAEGMKRLHSVVTVPEKLFLAGGKPALYSDFEKKVYLFDDQKVIEQVPYVRRIVDCADKDGKTQTFLITDGGICKLTEDGFEVLTEIAGTCAAVHYERLFVGSGTRIYYSAPLAADGWTDMTAQAAGYIDFPTQAGGIFEAVSFKEKLYLFRERGITVLTAYADTLNFKAATIPYACGKLLANSVVPCGEKIYFFTERGLHCFDGAVCKRVTNADDGDIDFSAGLSVSPYAGGFIAAVVNGKGEKVMYCYDPLTARGRYVNLISFSVAGDSPLYYNRGVYVYELTGKSMPDVGECAFEMEFSVSDAKSLRKIAEAVTVEGEGSFRIELSSDYGNVSARGGGGRRIRLSRAVRGECFNLRIVAEQSDFRIGGITLYMRREADYED